MKTCAAVVENGRIQLVIRKGEDGYDEFAEALVGIAAHGCMSWYGDITDAEGAEQSGLIITTPPESDKPGAITERTDHEATTKNETTE